jgi:hypothetical protein
MKRTGLFQLGDRIFFSVSTNVRRIKDLVFLDIPMQFMTSDIVMPRDMDVGPARKLANADIFE